jgi:HSP20 family molecular chaperone IbpA
MPIDLSYINKIKKICGNQIINLISKMPVILNVDQTITAATRPENKTYKIPMNVVEDDSQFELRMNVTGFTKEEVSISTNENILTVKSQKPAQEPDSKF